VDKGPIEISTASPLKRASLWLMCLAVVLIVALKPDDPSAPWDLRYPPWNYFYAIGWPLAAISIFLGWRSKDSVWLKTLAILTLIIAILFFGHVDSMPSNDRALELFFTLGLGIIVLPALLAKFWLKTPLDYKWLSGKWKLSMWLWLPLGVCLAIGVLYLYFFILTPTAHTSWPLVGTSQADSLARIYWGVNIGGLWDELVWINLVYTLLRRHFSFWEANFAQAFFFTSFLYDIAFFGAGPFFIFPFALIQGYTYRKTGSLLYIVILHLMIDSVLFFMIANRYYPGWGWGG
jgi:membrane protease YdiL (CAAX protease family)